MAEAKANARSEVLEKSVANKIFSSASRGAMLTASTDTSPELPTPYIFHLSGRQALVQGRRSRAAVMKSHDWRTLAGTRLARLLGSANSAAGAMRRETLLGSALPA